MAAENEANSSVDDCDDARSERLTTHCERLERRHERTRREAGAHVT